MKLRADGYAYVVILGVSLLVLGSSLGMEYLEARALPMLLAGVMFVLAAIGLVKQIAGSGGVKPAPAAPEAGEAETGGRRWPGYVLHGGWVAAFPLGIYLLGFSIGVALLLLFYMKVLGTRWVTAVIFAILTPVLLYALFEVAFQVELHRGVVFSWLGY